MTDAEALHDENEKLFRQHEGKLTPEQLQSVYEVARWLIGVHTGEIKCKCRKLMLTAEQMNGPIPPRAA